MRLHRTAGSSLALFALVTGTLVAQGARTSVELGITGGAAFSKPGGSDATEINGTYTGFAAGGFVRVGVSRYFAVQPELLFIRKGAKRTESGVVTTGRASYVQVPLLAEVRFPSASVGRVVPHFFAGPAMAIKTGCSVKESSTAGSISASCAAAGNNVKGTDFSLLFGGGIEVGRASIDLRYDLGLTTLDADTPPDDVKNRTFYVLAGWRFGHLR